jgi:hypothetical protein
MVPGSVRNWIAVNAVQQFSLNKIENKNDDSTFKKINQPVAIAACFPFRPARSRVDCAFPTIQGGYEIIFRGETYALCEYRHTLPLARRRRRICPGSNTATSMPWAGLPEGNYNLQ